MNNILANPADIPNISKEELEKMEAKFKREEQLQHRKKLLEIGTFTEDKKFYFTERTAEKFVMDYASLEADERLVWKRADTKEIVELTKEEAKPYVVEIKTVLRSVYGLLED